MVKRQYLIGIFIVSGIVLSLLNVNMSPVQSSGSCIFNGQVQSGNYTLDVQSEFAGGGAVDWNALNSAIACAQVGLGSGPGNGVTVTLQLPAATIDLSSTYNSSMNGSIDVSGFNCPNPTAINCGVVPGDQNTYSTNQLIIEGAGIGLTTIILTLNQQAHDQDLIGIYGHKTTNVTFTNMSFTSPYMTVTQGTVVSSTTESVTLDIQKGFPTPLSIVDIKNFPSSARYLRKFTYFQQSGSSTTFCRIIQDPLNNGSISYSQIPWAGTGLTQPDVQKYPMRWTIPFESAQTSPPYEKGDILGIKSKEGKNVYQFQGAANITFDRVQWLRKSRGVFGGMTDSSGNSYGVTNVTITNSQIIPEAAVEGVMPCLATPDGGPQFGGNLRIPSSGHLVSGNTFHFTGDDPVGLFDVSNSLITNNNISDSFSGRAVFFDFSTLDLSNAGDSYCPNALSLDIIYQMTQENPLGIQATCP